MSSLRICDTCDSNIKNEETFTDVCSYDWKVSTDELEKMRANKNVESSTFPLDSSKNFCTWQLLWKCGFINSNAYNEPIENESYYSICLKLCSAFKSAIIVNYSIEGISNGLTIIKAHNGKAILNPSNDINILDISPNTTRNPPTIRISISAVIQPSLNHCHYSPNCNFLKEINSMFEGGKWSDVLLKIGEKQIKAHKNILGARSPVLAAKFEPENTKCFVEVTHFTYDIMYKLTRYMYLNTIDIQSWEEAKDLLMASDTYGLDDLKLYISTYLILKINDENALQLLIVANECDSKILENGVKNYIVKNCKSFESPESYNILKNKNDLLIQLLTHLTKALSEQKLNVE